MNWQWIPDYPVTVLTASFAMVALLVGCVPGRSAQQDLPIVVTESGFRIALTSVVATDEQIVLTFRIEDEQPQTPPSVADLGGVAAASDLVVTDITLRDAATANDASPAGASPAKEAEIVLGPAPDLSDSLSFDISQLVFGSSDGEGVDSIINGPWRFTFTPDAV